MLTLSKSMGRRSVEELIENNNSEGKLLICLRDLSKYRDGGVSSSTQLSQLTSSQPQQMTSPHLENALSNGEVEMHKQQHLAQPESPEPGSTVHKPTFSVNGGGGGGGGVNEHEAETVKVEPISGSTPPLSTSPMNCASGATGHPDVEETKPRQDEHDYLGTDPTGGGNGRQLSKLKRFLTTLQQFASDISPEIGDRVHSLVLGLVNSRISVEEFHQKLQESTNFPLRPFVIPFLKTNLPLLQKEIMEDNRSKGTPMPPGIHMPQGIHMPPGIPMPPGMLPGATPDSHKGIQMPPGTHPGANPDSPPLFDFLPLPYTPHHLGNHNLGRFPTSQAVRDSFHLRFSDGQDVNENGKRRTPDTSRTPESLRLPEGGYHSPSKRLRSTSPPADLLRLGPSSGFNFFPPLFQSRVRVGNGFRVDDQLEDDKCKNVTKSEIFSDTCDRFDGHWSQMDNMLQCIAGMVDKCKRILALLQLQSRRDLDELSLYVSRHDDLLNNPRDMTAFRNETSSGVRRTDELQLIDVRKRAEEAVNEVKRQAMDELHRAVTAAEAKANMTVAAERIRIEKMIGDIKLQARQEAIAILNRQEESNENCWNCGRKASETCSGCNVARYCGAFCQHKDWETHHRTCRHSTTPSGSSYRRSSTAQSPNPIDSVEPGGRSRSKSPLLPAPVTSHRKLERRSGESLTPHERRSGESLTHHERRSGESHTPHERRSGESLTPHERRPGESLTPHERRSGESHTPHERRSGESLTPHERRSGESLTPHERRSRDNITPLERRSRDDIAPVSEPSSCLSSSIAPSVE